MGGLPTLLALLSDADAGVRSRAAAVLGACAQNNAPTQQVLLITLMPLSQVGGVTGGIGSCGDLWGGIVAVTEMAVVQPDVSV